MRSVLLILSCAVLPCAAGCGGSVVVDGTGDGGSSTDSTTSSSSPSGGGGGATVTTGGGAGSTGTDTTTGTGTTTTTTSAPIACGDTSCDGATQQCCASMNGAKCISPGDPCQGITLTCSSSANCDPGEICCASFGNGPDDAQATCKKECGGPGPGGGVQLCASDAECKNGGKCEQGPGGFFTCHNGGPGGGG